MTVNELINELDTLRKLNLANGETEVLISFCGVEMSEIKDIKVDDDKVFIIEDE